MTEINLGDFRLRFDPKEVRINIDGEMIDIGAKREEEDSPDTERVLLRPGIEIREKKKSDQKLPE